MENKALVINGSPLCVGFLGWFHSAWCCRRSFTAAVSQLSVRQEKSMAKRSERDEARRIAWERECEKDMVYYVRFRKKGTNPPEYFENIGSLHRDPLKHPATLERAISAFQAREGVSDWREIADGYDSSGYWYG